jgi:hypothetical protein
MLAMVAAFALATSPIPVKFSAAFIQLDDSSAIQPSSRLDQKKWGEVLTAMRAAQFDTVIIQQVGYHKDGKDYIALRPGEADDAIEAILAEADRLGMTVYLGSWNVGLSETDLKSDDHLDAASKRSLELLDVIKRHPAYTDHQSLGGWYLPVEPWNYIETGEETRRLRDHYLIPLSRACKAIVDKPVAFSCYFNPKGYAAPRQTRDTYKALLKGAGVDILLPQDGVGERSISDRECRDYFEAFKQACDDQGVKMWPVLECFTKVAKDVRVPCDPKRLVSQFENAHGLGESFAAYDFFHYMNPIKYLWADDTEMTCLCVGGAAAARKPLYEGYIKLITTGP